MKKIPFITLCLLLLSGASLKAQNADEQRLLGNGKYQGCHTLTLYDSTTVFMEESGLSYVEGHRRVRMLDYDGCRANSVVKMDYDPLSAYVEIRQVLVHRYYSNSTDTIVSQSKGTVYDYVAPARLIYWGASQKMVEVGHLDPRGGPDADAPGGDRDVRRRALHGLVRRDGGSQAAGAVERDQ